MARQLPGPIERVRIRVQTEKHRQQERERERERQARQKREESEERNERERERERQRGTKAQALTARMGLLAPPGASRAGRSKSLNSKLGFVVGTVGAWKFISQGEGGASGLLAAARAKRERGRERRRGVETGREEGARV